MLRQVVLVGSILQQKIGYLRVAGLLKAKTILMEIIEMKATLRFNCENTSETRRIVTYSDGSFNISSKQVYGHCSA